MVNKTANEGIEGERSVQRLRVGGRDNTTSDHISKHILLHQKKK